MNVRPADGAESAATSAIGTGDVHTDGGASASPADINTGNTNNPVGLDGTTPMGPSDGTQVINAADPADAYQPSSPANICAGIGAAATSSVNVARKRKARGSHNRKAQDEHKRQRRAALLLTMQGDTGAGT